MYCILPKNNYHFIKLLAIHEYVFSVPSIILNYFLYFTFLRIPRLHILRKKLHIDLFDFKLLCYHLCENIVVLLIIMCAVRFASVSFENDRKSKLATVNDPPKNIGNIRVLCISLNTCLLNSIYIGIK